MKTSDFYLTPCEIDAVLSDIERAVWESDYLIDSVEQIMNDLNQCWRGQTYHMYLTAFRCFKEIIKPQFDSLMKEYQQAFTELKTIQETPEPVINFRDFLGW